MLGFATVDLSTRDNILTVWLTSAEGAASAVHTNAVTFDLDDDTTSRRALAMVCDRYVILTDRTPRDHRVLVGRGVEPSDLAMLTKHTTAAQATVRTACSEYRTRPGKSQLSAAGAAVRSGTCGPSCIGDLCIPAVDPCPCQPGDADLDSVADH